MLCKTSHTTKKVASIARLAILVYIFYTINSFRTIPSGEVKGVCETPANPVLPLNHAAVYLGSWEKLQKRIRGFSRPHDVPYPRMIRGVPRTAPSLCLGSLFSLVIHRRPMLNPLKEAINFCPGCTWRLHDPRS